MVDARIYVSHIKAYPVLYNELFVPIQAGRVQAERVLPDIEGDHTGSHISDRYSQWGELTSLYWVWKNARHDYVGWMQSMRFLSLSQREGRDDSISGFSQRSVRHYGWTLEQAQAFLKGHDVVVPQTYAVEDITALRAVKTPYTLYLREGGTERELELMLALVRDLYPEKYIHALEFMHGHFMRPWHLFVMKHALFHEYASFLFDILTEFTKNCDMEGRIGFQHHNWMFLAECLLNIEITYLLSHHDHVNIVETPIIYIDDHDFSYDRKRIIERIFDHEKAITRAAPKPVSFGGEVHIVISFNDQYFKPACATISSILSHTANQNDMVFYVIHDDGLSRATATKVCNVFKGITFNFIKVKESFVANLPLNRSYINVNTYYRLLIHNLIPQSVKRIVYLDTDISVCSDIVDLWNTDMGSSIIAGSRDESGAVGSWRLFGDQMNDRYINAGVLVFDLEKARDKYGNLDFLYSRSFYENYDNITMQDQDILNIAYKDDIALLPLNWNVPSSAYYRKSAHSDGNYEGKESFLSKKEISEAALSPNIIHFTGRQKPWKINSMHPLKKIFWFYLRKNVSFSFKDTVSSLNSFLTVKKNRIVFRSKKNFHEWPLRGAIRKHKR